MADARPADRDVPPPGPRVAVLLSGGVDSSVALARLVRAGHRRVTAYYLKVWLEDELAGLAQCPWEEDLGYARAVCDQLDVPLEVVSLQRQYRETVIAYTLAELQRGRTPSPDLLCNREIKLGAFLEVLGDEELIATGHYARLRRAPRPELLLAVDRQKDQTYFLSRLFPEQLARCVFPLGSLHKPEVRELARLFALPTHARPDSQGLCFLGDVRYRDFVRAHLGERPGDIRRVDDGERLGRHRGHFFYTIGQRHGLGLAGGPWLVVEKDPDGNVVWVARREEVAATRTFRARSLHWIGEGASPGPCAVKIRHGATMLNGQIADLDGDQVIVELARPELGLAAGQFAVFYDGERCLGSGVIDPCRPPRRHEGDLGRRSEDRARARC